MSRFFCHRFLGHLAAALFFVSGLAYAQSPKGVEPDEGGIGGTGHSLQSGDRPDRVDRPDMPERIEKIEPIDVPSSTETLNDGTSSPTDLPDRDHPPSIHH